MCGVVFVDRRRAEGEGEEGGVDLLPCAPRDEDIAVCVGGCVGGWVCGCVYVGD